MKKEKKQKITNPEDWLMPEERKKKIKERLKKAGYIRSDLERLKRRGIDLVALLADKDRLDFLQTLTDQKRYTGTVALRLSATGRGWRLHETSGPYGMHKVRNAIDFFMKFEYEEDKEE